VFVDGYYVGIVDDFDGVFQSLDVPPGGHELVLYLEGYRTIRQSFYVTAAKTFKVSYTMVRLGPGEAAEPPPQPPARPPDEEMQPPAREPAPAPQAPEPPQPPRQPRAPRPPRPAPVEPAPRDVRGFGTLSIRVQPADAEVLIDGERWRGPEAQERLLVNVAEGSHHVEIQKAGFVTYSTDIQVRSGETATLNVSLPPRDPQGESR
jgi:outer membrane biosynthesis protein TonB